MNPSAATYDGFSFIDNGLVVTNIGHMELAKRNNQVEKRANRNGGVLVQSLLDVKPITIEGYYIGTSITDAQTMYDTLARVMNRQQRPLIIPHAGSTRTYTATPENVVIQEPDGLNRLTFSFQFVVPEGSSQDALPTTLFSTSVTTTSSTTPLTIAGSVRARPLITITITAITGGTSKTMSIRNGRDLVGLTFSRTFVAGDVIQIDSANFQIYINGVLTEPTGRMPTWEPGDGTFYYADTFTTRTVSITASYYRGDL